MASVAAERRLWVLRPHWLRHMDSVVQAPVVVVRGLSCASASGIFPDQESNLHPLSGRWILMPWTTGEVLFCVPSDNRQSGVVTRQNAEAAQGDKVFCIHEPQRGRSSDAAVQSGGRK